MDQNNVSLENLRLMLRQFVKEREWEQFHYPKNLAISVAVEASELLEIFMWLTPDQSDAIDDRRRQRAEEEIGDVLLCLLNLAGRLGIDPVQAAYAKLKENAKKYPVEASRGTAKKYDEL